MKILALLRKGIKKLLFAAKWIIENYDEIEPLIEFAKKSLRDSKDGDVKNRCEATDPDCRNKEDK